MNSTYALIRLLVMVSRLIDLIIEKAAERQKAGNLEAIQAAIDLSKTAQTEEEARDASKALQDAFRKRT